MEKPIQTLNAKAPWFLWSPLLLSVIGSALIVAGWSDLFRDASCGDSKGAWVCHLFNALPFPVSELMFNALGVLFIGLSGASFIFARSDRYRIAVYADRLEFFRQQLVMTFKMNSLRVNHIAREKYESLELFDTQSGNAVTFNRVRLPAKDWKKLIEVLKQNNIVLTTVPREELPLRSKLTFTN